MRTVSSTWTSRLAGLAGLSPALLMTALLVMIAGMGFSIILPFLPLYGEKLGATSAQLGWMVSSFAIASAFASALGGRLADQRGRRFVLASGMGIFALATLLLAVAPNPLLFILFRFLEGIGYGLVLPTGNTIAQDLAPKERRGTVLGTYATITLLGTLIGPAVGGLLAEWLGYSALFFTVSGVALLAMVLALRVVPETSRPMCGAKTGTTPRLVLTPPLIAAYVAAGAVSLNNGLMQVVEVLFFRARYAVGVELIGVAFSCIAVAAILARLPGGFLVDRLGPRTMLFAGLLLSGAATAAIAIMPTFIAAVGASALGAFFGVLAFSAIPVVIVENVEGSLRGRANGVMGVLASIGLIIGAPIGTALYTTQVSLPFWTAGVTFAVAAFIVILMLRRPETT